MKIKLAILDQDINYLNRIVAVFSTKYADKLEVYSFTDVDMALATIDSARVDVFLADERYEIPAKQLPSRCGFAYFVEDLGLESFRGQAAVCKYQRADLIYNHVLNLYSEKAEGVSAGGGNGDAKVIWFCSAGGGCGSSTMAASAAIVFAKEGKRALYLNLDVFGDAGCYFDGVGQFDFSDVIYAVKSKKSTVGMKLESALRQDMATGVYFYAATQLALDMTELNHEDVQLLVSTLQKSGLFDVIVLDRQFDLDAVSRYLWGAVHSVVAVNDGSEIGNNKFVKAYQAMKVLSEQNDVHRLDKLQLLYNKFSNKTGQTLEGLDITMLGGIPRYEHASVAQIVQQVSGMGIFKRLL
ncbi:MAG: chromosome partitioning protein ParA [Lachnospiraceae bacterium]|nr:chromosome partitioning protein ParA [Lachnospiraceae bacterium]